MRRGFTLTELLLIITVISTVMGFSYTAASTTRSRARDARRIADVKLIQQALELYRYDVDRGIISSVYPYPLRYLFLSENEQPMYRLDGISSTACTGNIIGPGIYGNATCPSSWAPYGGQTIHPLRAELDSSVTNFRKHLPSTPRDPMKKDYIYYAPACMNPGKLTSPAHSTHIAPGRILKMVSAQEIDAQSNEFYCRTNTGRIPYLIYVLFEQPVTGQAKIAGLPNLSLNSRALLFGPSQPIYRAGSPTSSPNSPPGIVPNIGQCFPRLTSPACPQWY